MPQENYLAKLIKYRYNLHMKKLLKKPIKGTEPREFSIVRTTHYSVRLDILIFSVLVTSSL
jgi:hypothetical protein